MSELPKNHTTVACSCGSVKLEVTGAPITSAVCYCDDCQKGSSQIEALPNARAVRDPDDGTAYVLYRKDRVTCSTGAQLLQDYKLTEKSATSRVVATCCNSAMYLKVDPWGHWFSVYRVRFQEHAPPLQMRIYTKFKPEISDVSSDVPSYATFPLKFVAKLVVAKIATLLQR